MWRTNLVPPVFGFWGGDYTGTVHNASDATSDGSFSVLPSGAYLCLMSVPVGSYTLEVAVGDLLGSASSCLELESGAKIYEGSAAVGAIERASAVVQKESLGACLTLRACADAVVNSWEVSQIACHSSCGFCSGTAESQCTISCMEGRTLDAGDNGTYCLARVPYAPTGLADSEVTNSSLRLSWEAGLSGGEPLTGYVIWASQGADFSEMASVDLATSAELTGLAGDTEYSFKVQALSSAGSGDLSAALGAERLAIAARRSLELPLGCAAWTVRTGPLVPEAVWDLVASPGQPGAKRMARVLFPAVRAVSLDVFGTLVVHRHPIHETYAACALWAKLENPPTAEELRPAFKQAYREALSSDPCFGHEAGISSRTWWEKTVRLALTHTGREYPREDFRRYFRRVYQHYGSAEAYEELPDAKDFLVWARQQGLALGVTSNTPDRVMDTVLPMLGFHDHFKWFVSSQEVGYQKPEPWIFVETYREASFWVEGVKREEILHVGDGLAADFCGARAAGLQAVLLDRGEGKQAQYQDWLEGPDYQGKSEEDIRNWTLQDLGQVKDLIQRSIIQQLQ
ncbi:unnamed protein product [Effrenium voratum]|uniref:Fibronectin type-III domain-containing protein n=1 Tax=Effrenium voratum TaxID=2562239 RepID=A0AA36JKL4_9DINO|nr:unnamed protein product [Effrenium voratum]